MHEPHRPRFEEADVRFRGPERRFRPLRFPITGAAAEQRALPWIEVAPNSPYFVTDAGEPWHPIGQNDAVAWEELGPLYRGRDRKAVDAHLAWLVTQGVTCLRLMLEYAEGRHRYIENPAGTFTPLMVRLWDDLFGLCEKHGLRILLTPFDTFWQWLQFCHHPYNRDNGGPLEHPSHILVCPETRIAIKNRLTFAVERWGGSGALFAWDLWNEIHPCQAQDSVEPFDEFITDLGRHVRGLEHRLYGRSHLQTVSLFGPELRWRSDMGMEGPIFRHPELDFATVHIYEEGTIDYPFNTVDPALGVGRVIRASLREISDGRPFLDTEHGPIHSFKDHKITLPEPFDDEYFRHMQWAHLACGGAGGGMRWPNRKPHVLTRGMRAAQRVMADFMPLIDWLSFDRRNVDGELEIVNQAGDEVDDERLARFGCASADQALLYVLRHDTLREDGRLDPGAPPLTGLRVKMPILGPGRYTVTAWDTVAGRLGEAAAIDLSDADRRIELPPLRADLALAITRT